MIEVFFLEIIKACHLGQHQAQLLYPNEGFSASLMQIGHDPHFQSSREIGLNIFINDSNISNKTWFQTVLGGTYSYFYLEIRKICS